MRQMDSYGLAECRFQAKLFELSATYQSCSSKIFIRRFMNSDLARRMDGKGFLYEATDTMSAFAELDEQYGISDYGKEKYSAEELHWIGYLLRYWVYISGRSSKSLYKLISTEELRDLYFPYHSLDPEQAINRIKEAKGIHDIDDIAYGVEVMRRVRKKYENK